MNVKNARDLKKKNFKSFVVLYGYAIFAIRISQASEYGKNSRGTGSIGILIKLYTETEMILPSNGGPQPSSRHVSEHGVSVVWKPLSRWITKGEQILKSYHVGVSSHLLPALIYKDEPPCCNKTCNPNARPFIRKVAGVVERAALEMR